jgi:hypothetical protein
MRFKAGRSFWVWTFTPITVIINPYSRNTYHKKSGQGPVSRIQEKHYTKSNQRDENNRSQAMKWKERISGGECETYLPGDVLEMEYCGWLVRGAWESEFKYNEL